MINLLSYDKKRDLKAARNNTAMMKSLLLLGSSALFLAAACTITMLFLNNSKDINDDLSKNASLSAETISVNQEAATARQNLSIAKNVLDSQVSYSKLLSLISSALPSGVILDDLDIDNSTINSSITLELHTSATDKINQIAQNFQSSAAFSSYDFVSAKPDPSNATYPTAITVRVKINKSNLNVSQ